MLRGENGEYIGSPTMMISSPTGLSTRYENGYLGNYLAAERTANVKAPLRSLPLIYIMPSALVLVLCLILLIFRAGRRRNRMTAETPGSRYPEGSAEKALPEGLKQLLPEKPLTVVSADRTCSPYLNSEFPVTLREIPLFSPHIMQGMGTPARTKSAGRHYMQFFFSPDRLARQHISDTAWAFSFFSLRVSSPGNFPPPLAPKEERRLFSLIAQGDKGGTPHRYRA